MAKTGRRPSSGDRYPCGKLMRAPSVALQTRILRGAIVRPPRSAPDMAIYVMTAGAFTKIGRSTNPASRARSIQVGQHAEVRVVWAVRLSVDDAISLERALHRRLRKRGIRVRGEWYNIDPEAAISIIEVTIRHLDMRSCPDPQFGIR